MSSLSNLPSFEITGLTAEQRTILDEIMRDLQTSVDRLNRAAKKWIELPEKVRAKIIDQTNPSFREFWRRLEAVGSGTLHPQLATVGGLAARLLGRLPLEDQERYLSERLPVVVPRGRGWDLKLIDVADLTEDQRKQVFKVSSDGSVMLRGDEAQKEWLAARAAKRMVELQAGAVLKKVERTGWTVERGRVWPKPSLVESGITKAQLERMLSDLDE